MRAHGESMGGGTLFLLLFGSSVLAVYFFYAYRSSLSARVAAVSHALMALALSFALFHASNLNHVAPGSAIGAAVGLWMYALLGQLSATQIGSRGRAIDSASNELALTLISF